MASGYSSTGGAARYNFNFSIARPQHWAARGCASATQDLLVHPYSTLPGAQGRPRKLHNPTPSSASGRFIDLLSTASCANHLRIFKHLFRQRADGVDM
jgi:hypothetical protein